MKIYFEDDYIVDISDCPELSKGPYYIIFASAGVSRCMNAANYLKAQNDPNIIIYTNCIKLFSNTYAWNEELKVPEIYIRHKDTREFIRIDKATPRELRKGHNLEKLYLSGEFDSVTNALDNAPSFVFKELVS